MINILEKEIIPKKLHIMESGSITLKNEVNGDRIEHKSKIAFKLLCVEFLNIKREDKKDRYFT